MKTLHYAGQPGDGFGWGVCNANLRRELGQRYRLTDNTVADIVFMPLADHDFNPCSIARGLRNVAYTFFEYDLGPNAAENAARYDVVFCGSTWCLERMCERGITNGRVLIQGVDNSIFRPMPRGNDGQFRVFSGGKFEFRKGQDIVIAAFIEFAKAHPSAHLVCAWNNPWPQLIMSMGESKFIKWEASGSNQVEFFSSLLVNNGLRQDQFTVLPQLSHNDLAAQMAQTDVGLFPNRCEGGTNLVLMEYLSCGRPAVANVLTGHADIDGPWITPIHAVEDASHWAEQTIPDVVESLQLCQSARGKIPKWTWAQAADTITETIAAL